MIRILLTHQYDSSSKMAENIQSYDKKEYLFSWKALFGNIFWYGPSFVIRLSFSEIYTGSMVASDLQVKIIITIENSLLTKLPYATIYILLSCNLTFICVGLSVYPDFMDPWCSSYNYLCCWIFSVPCAQCCLCLWIVHSFVIVPSGFSNVHCVNWHIKEVI